MKNNYQITYVLGSRELRAINIKKIYKINNWICYFSTYNSVRVVST